jgi:hypothetical protein
MPKNDWLNLNFRIEMNKIAGAFMVADINRLNY